ncbi:MAG: LysR family transcriptional regulator [Variovorax sp.]|nr:LysR family transcriptional regulator [Variovorax sp.]
MPVDLPANANQDVLLSDLRLFANAIDLGSLVAVARAMRLSKTSVTRQIQRLEATVGHRLLHRGNGRFALTEEGRELLVNIRGPLSEIEEAVSGLTGGDGPLQGRLRITAPNTFGRAVVAPTLASFMALHPAVSITLELSSRKVDLLADEADIAIRIGSPGSEQLLARRLSREGVMLCAAPAYLAKHPVVKTVADLAAHTLLDFRPDTGAAHFELVDANGQRQRIGPVRIALHSNDPEVLAIAAVQGAGIALLPDRFAHRALADGLLSVVLPGCGLPALEVHALYAPGRRQSSKIRAFLDHLVAKSHV